MDTQLVDEIKKLKNQGMNDEQIRESLKDGFPTEAILQNLYALRYMKAESEIVPIESTTDSKISSKKFKSRKGLYLFAVILLLVAGLPFVMRVFSITAIKQPKKILTEAYQVGEPYVLGAAYECSHSPRTRIGEVTSQIGCKKTTALLYYPRVELSAPRPNELNEAYHNAQAIEYVRPDGTSLRDYIHTGISVTQPGFGSGLREAQLLSSLKMDLDDSIRFSLLNLQLDKLLSEPHMIAGKWSWSPALPEYADNEFQEKIEKKLRLDQSPVPGAPTVTEAMSNNTAPLVVYHSSWYCHGPNIILLDRLCVLPN